MAQGRLFGARKVYFSGFHFNFHSLFSYSISDQRFEKSGIVRFTLAKLNSRENDTVSTYTVEILK